MRNYRFVTLFLIVVVGAGFLISGCGKDKLVLSNHLPSGSITATADSLGAGEVAIITADYTDSDGDELTYSWTAAGGRILNEDSSVIIWNAPDRRGIYSLYLWVNDGADSVQDSIRISVDQPVRTTDNYYLGESFCENCHDLEVGDPSIPGGWMTTAHYDAFTSLINAGQGANETCLPCHTTGWDTDVNNGGYDEMRFPSLETVQCEVCHGPGSLHQSTYLIADTVQSCVNSVCHPNESDTIWHGGNDSLLALMPHPIGYLDISMDYRLDAEFCKDCHQGTHYPYYVQWDSSAHSSSAEAAGAIGCGDHCHTGWGYLDTLYYSERLRTYEYPLRPNTFPWNFNPDTLSITCLTCHDPHYNNFTGQLREDGGFQCASCHNPTQLEVDSLSTPYHVHGPMVQGFGGYEYAGTTYENSDHTLELRYDKCSGCHVSKVISSATYGFESNTHHMFGATAENCNNCHTGVTSDFVVSGLDAQDTIQTLLNELDTALDGYGTPGDVTYNRAEFNKLFVENDGSLGIHNYKYAYQLLKDAVTSLQ